MSTFIPTHTAAIKKTNIQCIIKSTNIKTSISIIEDCLGKEYLVHKNNLNKLLSVPIQSKFNVGDTVLISNEILNDKGTPMFVDSYYTIHLNTLSKIIKININESSVYLILENKPGSWNQDWVKIPTKEEEESHKYDEVISKILISINQYQSKDLGYIQNMIGNTISDLINLYRKEENLLIKLNETNVDMRQQFVNNLTSSLKMLSKDERILEIKDTNLSCIEIITKNLYYTQSNIHIKPKHMLMGSFQIIINLTNNLIKVYGKTGVSNTMYNLVGHIHPHISSTHNICWGNLSNHVAVAFKKFKLFDLVMMVLELLQSYNDKNPYKRIDVCHGVCYSSEEKNLPFVPFVKKKILKRKPKQSIVKQLIIERPENKPSYIIQQQPCVENLATL